LQINYSATLLKGDHAIKAGIDIQHVNDTRTSAAAQLYTFPSTAAYLCAKDGSNRFGYTSFTQYFGLPDLAYSTNQSGVFVQDDWRVNADLKLLYGVRYDLYGVPDGVSNALIASSQEFP